MNVIGPDPGPDVFLSHHLRRLRALAVSLRDTPSRTASDALRDSLRLHAVIEERICFPALLSAGAPAAVEVVAASRTARGAALDAVEKSGASGGQDLAARLEAYASFEEKRLVPLFALLPGVTLREMALEIQELVGRRGRARGA